MISRERARALRYVLDQLLPPLIRDSRWLMALPLRLAFGKRASWFAAFKERATAMTDAELADVYRQIGSLVRESDLTAQTASAIEQALVGRSVLEVGCGRGVLAASMARSHDVTAVDLFVSQKVHSGGVAFLSASATALPFADRSFDSVVCAHTLEHVLDLQAAIRELRRLARRRLILVVPRQRPYRYTFDLHLHFFPYAHSLLGALRPPLFASCRAIGDDFVYWEDCGPLAV